MIYQTKKEARGTVRAWIADGIGAVSLFVIIYCLFMLAYAFGG